MGAQQSKEQPQTFLPKQTPTEFTPDLIKKLDSAIEVSTRDNEHTIRRMKERSSQFAIVMIRDFLAVLF